MAKLKIGLSRPKKFMLGSWAISVWMRKPYSHTYVRFNMNRADCIFEASHGSVHFSDYQKFTFGNLVNKEYEIEVSDAVMTSIKAKCLYLQGEKYSVFQIAQIMFWDTCNTFGIKAGTEDRKGYICSELVGRICVEDLKIEFDKPTWLLTPSDIENKLDTLYSVA
jgi:hypothetical protein